MTTKTFLAFSCTHCPLEDKEAVDWMLDQISLMQPDYVVHLGDGHEANAASRFPNEYSWSLEDEFKAHNELLRRVRLAAPKAKRIFCEGNHDRNLLEKNRIPKDLRSLAYYADHEPELKKYWELGCEYSYDPSGTYRLGQVLFAHGYGGGGAAERDQTIRLGIPYGLYVSGHTHRPKPVEQAHVNQKLYVPYWYANPGCMRNMKPNYARRSATDLWGQGVVVGDFLEYDAINNPKFTREWSAETLVFRWGYDAPLRDPD